MPQARKKLFFITALTARQAMALVMVRGQENPGRAGRRTRWQMRRLREAVVAAGLEDAVGLAGAGCRWRSRDGERGGGRRAWGAARQAPRRAGLVS